MEGRKYTEINTRPRPVPRESSQTWPAMIGLGWALLLGPAAPFSRAVCGLQSIENVVKQRELVPANEDIVAGN